VKKDADGNQLKEGLGFEVVRASDPKHSKKKSYGDSAGKG
jgi:hypothetical protein